jgi:protein involved in polysaccharide export with SLBB domain
MRSLNTRFGIFSRSVELLGLVIVLTAGLRAGLSAQARDTIAMRPGDAVKIEVWRNTELSGTFPIDADGDITHPLYREIHAAGMTEEQLRSTITSFLQKYSSDPQFTLVPLLRVAVAGEVRSPSILTVPRETTVAEAVGLAGGTNDRGDLQRVKLLRRGQVVIINLKNTMDQVAWDRIHSGDQIVVPRRVDYLRDYIAPVASVLAAIGTLLYRLR